MRLAFDIETDGLLDTVSTLHSLVLKDLDSGEVWSASAKDPMDLVAAVSELGHADYLTGHNVLSYDLPVLRKLYPGAVNLKPSCVVRDTMIMAKMIWPVERLKELDFPRWRKGALPGQLIGAHRLEAWGYRLGEMKGDYSDTVKGYSKTYAETGDLTTVPEPYRVLASVDAKGRPCLDPWKSWNQPMQDYCVQDVAVTTRLHELIEGHLKGTAKAAGGIGWSDRSVDLEHRVWLHLGNQERRGFGFDLDGAVRLAGELKTRQRQLEDRLIEVFGEWWEPQDDPKTGTTPARDHSIKMTEFPEVVLPRISEKTGKPLKPYIGPPLCHFTQDAPFVRIKRVRFNPKSRQHLGDRLQAVFGWVPVEWGGKDGTQAKVDETTIEAISEGVLPKAIKDEIMEYLVVSKTLGQLADGNKSWIGFVADDGAIHGRMDPLGTVSHRGSHFDPNLGQVPAVSKDKQDNIIWGWEGGFGAECRSLFRPKRRDFEQTGTDAAGLELRLLGHYLWPYDDGDFAKRVSTPGLDIHAENAKITGLTRADTKTVTYAFLYGAGPLKVGLGVGIEGYDIEALANSADAKRYVGWMKRKFKEGFRQPDPKTLALIVRGSAVIRSFQEGITGLKDLKSDLSEEAQAHGFIIAIDGRKLSIRKPHATLNQALQGGGAVVCKEWMLETDRLLREDFGLKEDEDYGQMAWVHDELQFQHRVGLHEQVKEASLRAIQNVARSLGFRGDLATDAKGGLSWKECH